MLQEACDELDGKVYRSRLQAMEVINRFRKSY